MQSRRSSVARACLRSIQADKRPQIKPESSKPACSVAQPLHACKPDAGMYTGTGSVAMLVVVCLLSDVDASACRSDADAAL